MEFKVFFLYNKKKVAAAAYQKLNFFIMKITKVTQEIGIFV